MMLVVCMVMCLPSCGQTISHATHAPRCGDTYTLRQLERGGFIFAGEIETINNSQNYWGQNIMIGEHVTTTKPEGPVLIQNTNVKMKATSVELHPGTTITNSNVEINVPDD